MSPSPQPNACLQLLPNELLHAIFRLLDPIGLVSASQTCSRFRRVISPGKQELIERLLALECLEEYGGGTPSLRARDQKLEPYWTEKEWENYRWACGGCLRLRPHTHFDNRSILRLRTRKPIPGSPAVQLFTSWEPSLHGKTWGRCAQKVMSKEERGLRRRYRVAIYQDEHFHPPMLYRWTATRLREIGMSGFGNISDEQFQEMEKPERDVLFDRNIRDMELVRCGLKRHTRRCNECRYQAGQLRVPTSDSRGTRITPIQTSRQLPFASPNDRFFPGLPEYLGIGKAPLNVPIGDLAKINSDFEMLPQGLFGSSWTMYMLRCCGCERWQEMRAFRIGEYTSWWRPKIGAELWYGELLIREDLDAARCNACFAREHGTLALGKILCDFVQYIICDTSRCYVERQLCWGWFALEKVVSKLPCRFRKPVRHLLRNTQGKMARSWDGDDFSFLDIANLRVRHREFAEIWEEMKGSDNETVQELSSDSWFQAWLHSFDELEAEWLWMNVYTAKVRENHETLVKWALSRDGASLT